MCIRDSNRFNAELARSSHPDIEAIATVFLEGVQAVAVCIEFIVSGKDPVALSAGAAPFLKLMGIVAGGWQMARAALVAERKLIDEENADISFLEAKIATARFYADHVLAQAPGLRNTVVSGSAAVMSLSPDQFLAV